MIDSKLGEIYDRQGYYIAQRLWTERECDTLKAEALRVLQQAKPGISVYVGAAAISPLFRQLADDARVVNVLRAIMPDGIAFMSDKIVFKSGAQRTATPWHTDAAYWPNTRPKVSVWIALDDVSAANGTLLVVDGSHRREWNTKTVQTKEFVNVIENKSWSPSEEIVCTVPRGSAVFFSDRLVHGSTENTAGADRYTIISTYHSPAVEEEFDLQFPARHVIDAGFDSAAAK